jgi:putative FmdB family regulatory protein
MPLYEYRCESCEKVTERIQKFSDPLLEICPACGGRVTKLVSSPAIQFKGSGFYITDYARKSSDGSKSGKDEGSDKTERAERAEKAEKAERAEKTEKTEKTGRADTSEKAGKSEKAEKPSASSGSAPAKSDS